MKKTNVKGYERTVKGKKQKVKPHTRTIKSPKKLEHWDISPERKFSDRQLSELYFYPTIGIDSQGYIESDGEFIDVDERIWVGSGIEQIAEEEGYSEHWEENKEEFYKEVDYIMESYLGDYMYDASGVGYWVESGEVMYVMLNLADSREVSLEDFDEDKHSDDIDKFITRLEDAQIKINSIAVEKFPYLKKYMDKYSYNVGYMGYPIYYEKD